MSQYGVIKFSDFVIYKYNICAVVLFVGSFKVYYTVMEKQFETIRLIEMF